MLPIIWAWSWMAHLQGVRQDFGTEVNQECAGVIYHAIRHGPMLKSHKRPVNTINTGDIPQAEILRADIRVLADLSYEIVPWLAPPTSAEIYCQSSSLRDSLLGLLEGDLAHAGAWLLL